MTRKRKKYTEPETRSIVSEPAVAYGLNIAQPDWWDELTKEQKKDIQEGNSDLEAGKVVSSAVVWKRYGRKPLR